MPELSLEADVLFYFPGNWDQAMDTIQRALDLRLRSITDGPDDEEPPMESEPILGHSLRISVIMHDVVAVGISRWPPTGRPKDVTAALALLIHTQTNGSWVPINDFDTRLSPNVLFDPARLPADIRWEPRPCALGFDLEIEAPDYEREMWSSTGLSSEDVPRMVSGLELGCGILLVPELGGEHWTDSDYIGHRLGMDIRLRLGTPDHPLHRLTGTPVSWPADAARHVIDIGPEIADVLHETNPNWRVRCVALESS